MTRIRARTLAWVLTSCWCSACAFAVPVGSPVRATTVGKGHRAWAIRAEGPTLPLSAEFPKSDATGGHYEWYGGVGLGISASLGVTERTDIDAQLSIPFWIFVPLLDGASLGIRHHLVRGSEVDIAVATSLGGVGMGASSSEEGPSYAVFGTFEGVIQRRHGRVRPALAITTAPAWIKSTPPNEAWRHTDQALVTAVTVALPVVFASVTIGPYVSAMALYSDQLEGSGWFVIGGIMFEHRRDRANDPALP